MCRGFYSTLILVVDILQFASYLSKKERERVSPEGFISVSPKWIGKESNSEEKRFFLEVPLHTLYTQFTSLNFEVGTFVFVLK